MNNEVKTPLEELNLTDRFLFAETMDEPEAYEAVVAARSKSTRVKLVHSKVEKIRRSEKWGVKYMQRWEEILYARQDGRKEGCEEGKLQKIIAATCKKLTKGKRVEQIADELEEELERISQICNIAEKYAPAYDQNAIYQEMVQKEKACYVEKFKETQL